MVQCKKIIEYNCLLTYPSKDTIETFASLLEGLNVWLRSVRANPDSVNL